MKRYREKTSDLVRRREFDRAWQRHCGFLDLSLDQFMEIQWRLLEEQMELGRQSPLWQRVFGDVVQELTVENFRDCVPLTSYPDYEPHLQGRPNDILSRPIKDWARTSGLGGSPKWVPYTEEMYEHLGVCSITTGILCAARGRGDVRIRPGDVVASNLPPRPFISGLALMASSEFFDYHFIPPLDETEHLSFHDRTRRVFELAMRDGMALLGAMTIVLVRMGEMFESGHQERRFSLSMLHPKIIWRIIRAIIRARREGRDHILPRDLWQLKGLQCGGTDTFLFRDKIKYYWGVEPYEIYAATEAGIMAVQAWDRQDLYFLPDTAFYEFIPHEAWVRERLEGIPPQETVLMHEVEVGKRYEVVITNFYGGPFLRYRMHDLVEVVGMGNDALGIQLPRFQFVGRSGSFIDLSGFAGLIDEKTLLRALDRLGVPYVDWVVAKEFEGDQPYLHLYIEPREGVTLDATTLRDGLHDLLKEMVVDYKDVEGMLGYRPLKVTLLSPGTFDRYIQHRLRQGADLAHLKPARIQPPAEAIALLVTQSHAA